MAVEEGQGRCQFHEQDQGKKDRNFGLQSHAEVPKVRGHLKASDVGIATDIPGDRQVGHTTSHSRQLLRFPVL